MRKQIANHSTEAEVAKAIVSHLENQGWETYKEVRAGGVGSRIADIVAIKDGLIFVIEAKLSFTAVVVEQAWQWRRDAHFIAVAVPFRSLSLKGSTLLRTFCRQEGIGVFGVRPFDNYRPDQINQVLEPFYRHIDREHSQILKNLLPEQKNSKAGTKGQVVTPYGVTIDRIEEFLKVNGPTTLNTIVNTVPHHYQSKASAKSSLKKNLMKFEFHRFVKIDINGEIGFALRNP